VGYLESGPTLDRISINASAVEQKWLIFAQMEHAADSRQKKNLLKMQFRILVPVIVN